ncbi:MAG TPA: helix-turn-helix transcriptional regulator [Propionicimonas sp.]|jgi:transcriptional regulator with XRE-family HTH domain|uniref:helix-turn-helix transcriptional regulator n=1 Tax=Propionicimonas sp. TaxID=1955623 RepID=UPI002F3F7112
MPAAVNRELADFLRRARGACDPLQAGVPFDGRVRRVRGLRREEVALLAGISTDYYTRLEQGRRIVPSTQVVDALSRALGLDLAGHTHLRDLIAANAGNARRARSRAAVQHVRPGLHQLLDTLDTQPALILGRRTDVLATNRLARALFADFDRMPARERNYARWMFLSEAARGLFVDWDAQARSAVESLRLDAGNTPDDPDTQKLVGELSLASPEFGRWWSEHRVFQRTYGSKRLHHPLVGELIVDYETLKLGGDAEQTLYLYTTAPDSPSREAMHLLASWSQADLPGSRTPQTQR